MTTAPTHWYMHYITVVISYHQAWLASYNVCAMICIFDCIPDCSTLSCVFSPTRPSYVFVTACIVDAEHIECRVLPRDGPAWTNGTRKSTLWSSDTQHAGHQRAGHFCCRRSPACERVLDCMCDHRMTTWFIFSEVSCSPLFFYRYLLSLSTVLYIGWHLVFARPFLLSTHKIGEPVILWVRNAGCIRQAAMTRSVQ